MRFPDNKRFAFSVLDDTDDATLRNVKPVYDRLREYGFRTTKSVWPFDCPEGSRLFFAAATLQDKLYLQFMHELVDHGFEVAFHGATMESSPRNRTLEGLEFLRREFGGYPRVFCNHAYNRENLYWGYKRFQTPLLRGLARLIRRERRDYYAGEVEDSEYFWGDACREYIRFVRGFTFRELNMLKVNREMPYHLPGTPYVNYWFSTTDAPNVDAFNRLLSYERIDKLEEEGGVCIVSTHLGKGFANGGELNSRTEDILRYVSEKRGWFVPVSAILEYLLKGRTNSMLGPLERVRLELRFLREKVGERRR